MLRRPLSSPLFPYTPLFRSHAGAGRDEREAATPAVLEELDKGRVVLFSFGSTTSGIHREWGATSRRQGVNLLEDLSDTTARTDRQSRRLNSSHSQMPYAVLC